MDSGIQVGDIVSVKYLGRDSSGRYLISRKAVLPLPAGMEPTKPSSRPGPLVTAVPSFAQDLEIGSELEGVIIGEREYGFLLELAPGVTSLLHNSQINHSFVRMYVY